MGCSNFLAFVVFSVAISYSIKVLCVSLLQVASWEQGPLALTSALVPAVLTSVATPESPAQGIPITEKMLVLLLALQVCFSRGCEHVPG